MDGMDLNCEPNEEGVSMVYMYGSNLISQQHRCYALGEVSNVIATRLYILNLYRLTRVQCIARCSGVRWVMQLCASARF